MYHEDNYQMGQKVKFVVPDPELLFSNAEWRKGKIYDADPSYYTVSPEVPRSTYWVIPDESRPQDELQYVNSHLVLDVPHYNIKPIRNLQDDYRRTPLVFSYRELNKAFRGEPARIPLGGIPSRERMQRFLGDLSKPEVKNLVKKTPKLTDVLTFESRGLPNQNLFFVVEYVAWSLRQVDKSVVPLFLDRADELHDEGDLNSNTLINLIQQYAEIDHPELLNFSRLGPSTGYRSGFAGERYSSFDVRHIATKRFMLSLRRSMALHDLILAADSKKEEM